MNSSNNLLHSKAGYIVCVRGHLGESWTRWFGVKVQMRLKDNGETEMRCEDCDQAALFGLLRQLHDLGLPLMSVSRWEENREVGDSKQRERTP